MLAEKAGRYFNETTVKVLTGLIFVAFLSHEIGMGVLKHPGNDFTQFLDHARVFFGGGNPYTMDRGLLYPLFSIFIIQPLNYIPAWLAHFLWFSLNFYLLIGSLMFVQNRVIGTRFLWIPFGLVMIPLLRIFQANMIWGQTNIVVMSCVIAFMVFLKEGKKNTASFFLAAAVSIKLTPALFFLYLFVNREFGVAARTVFFIIVLAFGLPYLVADARLAGLYSDYFDILTGIGSVTESTNYFGRYFSIGGFFSNLGIKFFPFFIGLSIGAMLIIFLHLYVNRRMGGKSTRALYLYFLTVLLVAPLSEIHHMIWSFPPLLAVMHDLYTDRPVSYRRSLMIWALVVSFTVFNLARLLPDRNPVFFVVLMIFFFITFFWALDEKKE